MTDLVPRADFDFVMRMFGAERLAWLGYAEGGTA